MCLLRKLPLTWHGEEVPSPGWQWHSPAMDIRDGSVLPAATLGFSGWTREQGGLLATCDDPFRGTIWCLSTRKKPQQPLHRDLCPGWVSVTAGLLNATLRPHCYRVMTLNAEYESRISFPFNPPAALLIWLISKLPTDLHANWSLLIDKGNAAFELYLLCALYFLIGTECIFFAWTKIVWN